MPPLALLVPIGLPILGSLVAALLGRAGSGAARVAASVGVWSAAVALVALWLPVRSTQELTLGQLGFGSGLDLRLDGVAFAFGLVILVPSAVLLTLHTRRWPAGT